MFTGIIEAQARVLNLSPQAGSLKILVATHFKNLELGESIAINGVCLTVAETTSTGEALFFVSSETLQRTNLGSLKNNSLLNLERALTLQKRLSGHVVQGHVDGKAQLLSITPQADSFALKFQIPSDLTQYCVEKGSIALNGISLTINQIQDSTIDVMIIPHTWTHTNLSTLSTHEWVNVEVDVLAKYLHQFIAPYRERLCQT